MQNYQWLKFLIRTTHEAAFAIDNYLIAIGASGVSTIDKEEIMHTYAERNTPDLIIEDFLNDLDWEVIIEAYFPTRNNMVEVNRDFNLSEFIKQTINKKWLPISDFEIMLEQSLERVSEFVDVGKGYVGYQLIQDSDWSENWKKYYDTLKFGRIVINPSWLEYQPAADEILLNLDPGSAFGTGDHESTSLILDFLSSFNFAKLPQGPILDLGTGSGILSIAIAKIVPQREVIGVDIDPHSIEVANKNAVNNQVQVEFIVGELFEIEKKFSLIMANLIAAIHLDLVIEYYQKLMPGGYIIASGIINQRVAEVKTSFENAGFKLISEFIKNDWSALLYKK